MGNEKLTTKQMQMLSSCLDGELRGDELAKLSESLAADPRMAAEMADLLKVKSMAKELPTVKPPRNYRLTTIEAEEARPKPFWERLFPIFRGAAAFCALALAFVFIFPMFSGNASVDTADDGARLYASKSVSLAETTCITDERIVLDADREDSTSNGAVTASMPSYGVRGGSPRSEYLMMQAELQNQTEPEFAPAETASPAAGIDALTIAKIVLAVLLVGFASAAVMLGSRKRKLELK